LQGLVNEAYQNIKEPNDDAQKLLDRRNDLDWFKDGEADDKKAKDKYFAIKNAAIVLINRIISG